MLSSHGSGLPDSPQTIADLIEQIKDYHALSMFGLLFAAHPQQDLILSFAHMEDLSKLRSLRTDGTYHEIHNLQDVLNRARSNDYNLAYMRTTLSAHTIQIGDRLANVSYFDRAPILEFFRHIRNACAHNNALHFQNGEPRRPAVFRNFTLTSRLQGRTVLLDYLKMGDLLDLYDDLIAHLRTI